MFRLLTLGRCELFTDSLGEWSLLTTQPKRFALLTFLAVDAEGAVHRRDTLMAMFWPDWDETHARAALRKALHHLRRLVGPAVIVTSGTEEVSLDTEAIWCDARSLRAFALQGRHSDAVSHYEGEFLPGFHLSDVPEFERWADTQRQRLRATAFESALALVRIAHRNRTVDVAARWAQRAVEIDPINEAAIRALVEALAEQGQGASAIAAYERYASVLEQEIQITPSADLQAVVADIRAAVSCSPSHNASVGNQAPMLGQPSSSRLSESRALARPRFLGHFAQRLSVALAVCGLLVALGVAWIEGHASNRPESALAVAVLPLRSINGDTSQRYVADGVQNALIAELAQLASVRVLPRTSSNLSSVSRKTALQLARELSVDRLVDGDVERRHDTLDVHLRLLNVDGTLLWSTTYRRPLRQLSMLTADAAQSLAAELQGRTARARPMARPRFEPQENALDAWLRGSYHAARRTATDIEKCISYADEAIAIDPLYARAYDLLAQCNNLLSFVTNAPSRAMFEKAKLAARRALALDESLASAHAALAYALAAGDWNWAAAEREYRRAVQLGSESSHVHTEFAWFLSWIGRHDEAISQVRIAEQLDPISPETAQRAASVYYCAGAVDDAIREAKRAVAIDRDYMFGWERLHWAYDAKGMLVESIEAAEIASRLSGPTDTRRRAFVGHAYARAGRTAEAKAILEELLNARRESYVSPIAIGAVYIGLGDKQNAITWLERAYEEHDGGLVLLGSFPLWAPLHGEPGYQSLRKRLGL
ncbi:MAG: BTAD domain-containing putative transcriptional regulator [Gemmatimonadaceae bacterium]